MTDYIPATVDDSLPRGWWILPLAIGGVLLACLGAAYVVGLIR